MPKLHNLRRGAKAGLKIPPTVWLPAAAIDLDDVQPPPATDPPWIVRSASPTEDTDDSTAAGQFVTCVVDEGQSATAFATGVREVVSSLPRDRKGRPQGAVFVQPLLRPEHGGVLFLDGVHYECTMTPGGNREITAGSARGEVECGLLPRGGAFAGFCRALTRTFRRELYRAQALDVEFARDGDTYTLLQARPAQFPVNRDPLLSLANHKEILGDPPSPWIVSALDEAGGDSLRYFATVDPEVGEWGDAYAVAAAGRAWLNFGFFFRLMDHWGLPRSFVTQGVGGDDGGTAKPNPRDDRVLLSRMLRKSWRLLRLQWLNFRTVRQAERSLDAFRREVDQAADLCALHGATVFGLSVALRTNFAINGALTGIVRLRRALRLRGRARVTTEAMMAAYDRMRGLPDGELDPNLDLWLEHYGHRGPLESDPARARFAELRDTLRADLSSSVAGESDTTAAAPPEGRGFLFALDRRREWFRDELMRIWQDLRQRILAAADAEGIAREDVFLLTATDLRRGNRPDLEDRRRQHLRHADLRLPTTATLSTIQRAAAGGQVGDDVDRSTFAGVALSDAMFEGLVHRAHDLVALLDAERTHGAPLLTPETVLVVPALEPSWAVVFGRVGAVIAELGGELSHASILLREARKPAIVNCLGSHDALRDGDRVRIDGTRGVVERL